MSNFKAINSGTLIVNFADILFAELTNNGEPVNETTVTMAITHEGGSVSYATYFAADVPAIFAAAKYKKFNNDSLVINFDEIRLVNVVRNPSSSTSTLNITFNNGSTKSIVVPRADVATLFAN